MIRSFQGPAILYAILIATFVQEAAAFQKPKGPPTTFASSSVEQSFAGGAAVPTRRTQTRTESNGREVVTEVTETVGVDGKMKMSLETTSETTRKSPNTTQTKREVYSPDGQGRRRLVETTQIESQKLTNGASRSVADTYANDVNGRLSLSGREIQDVTAPSANVTQTTTTVFRPGINEPLTEAERFQKTENKISKDVTQTESTWLIRDGNGRWQTAETRSEDVRVTGNERVSEETVRRANANGALTVSEKTVTRQSKSNGKDETLTETYAENLEGIASAPGKLQLSQRVRSTTTTAPDGSQQTIREVEERNPVAPNGPMRVMTRTVDTTRQVGPNQWEVQRQVFAIDGNGKLVPVLTEKGRGTAK
jgi:hypothetical protein